MRHYAHHSLLAIFILTALGNVSSPSTDSARPTAAQNGVRFETIAPGVEYAQLTRTEARNEKGRGPWSINALRIDPTKARIKFVRALDEAVGLETVSSLVIRHNAIAGINGGYFRTTGTYRGESLGSLVLAGKLLSESHNDRAAVGLLGTGKDQIIFGRLRVKVEIRAGRLVREVDGVNRPPGQNELVIFTPEFHRTTLTSPEGVEVEVRHNRVSRIRDRVGSSRIPETGFVVSARGTAGEWVSKNIRLGTRLRFTWRFESMDSTQSALWAKAQEIVGGGPSLISNGQVSITNAQETIALAFVSDRHPRTAIAKLRSGELLLLTVDGRQPGVSVGMSLPGLAELLREFDAIDAINLDGGGSTTMVIQKLVVNRPSDPSGERPVSDAILVFPNP